MGQTSSNQATPNKESSKDSKNDENSDNKLNIKVINEASNDRNQTDQGGSKDKKKISFLGSLSSFSSASSKDENNKRESNKLREDTKFSNPADESIGSPLSSSSRESTDIVSRKSFSQFRGSYTSSLFSSHGGRSFISKIPILFHSKTITKNLKDEKISDSVGGWL